MKALLEFEDFYGVNTTGEVLCAIRDYFALAAQLQKQLGKKGYLMDTHTRLLLIAVGSEPRYTAFESGFEDVSELRSLIRQPLRVVGKKQEHPLHTAIQAYIGEHLLPWQERYTRNALYFVHLFDVFAKHMAEEYEGELRLSPDPDEVLDTLRLRKVRGEICELLGGEEEMLSLEEHFRNGFLIALPLTGFIQGMVDAFVSELLCPDEETGKYVFQLWRMGIEEDSPQKNSVSSKRPPAFISAGGLAMSETAISADNRAFRLVHIWFLFRVDIKLILHKVRQPYPAEILMSLEPPDCQSAHIQLDIVQVKQEIGETFVLKTGYLFEGITAQ